MDRLRATYIWEGSGYDSMMLGHNAATLSLEQTKVAAVAKKQAFQTFVVCLLMIDEFRDAIIDAWKERVAKGQVVTKLSDDYGNNRFTLTQLRDSVNINMQRAVEATDRVEKVKHIYNANLATSVYEELYKSLCGDHLKTHKIINDKYEEYIYHRNLLFQANLRLVPKFVTPFARRGVDFEDLVQEGRMGLLRAVEKYDPDREIKFSSYASWWIKQAIRKALKNDRRTVRLPHHVYDYVSKVSKASAAFRIQHQREPNLAELIRATGLSQEKIESLNGAMSDLISIETPMRVSREELKDYVSTEVEEGVPAEDAVLGRQMKDLIDQVLTDEEASIVRSHFGIDCVEESFTEAAKTAGCSGEKVRLILQRALKKLRAAMVEEEI